MARESTTTDESILLLRILSHIPRVGNKTTIDIERELQAGGIEIPRRRLQRYLQKIVENEEIFHVECDASEKPFRYSRPNACDILQPRLRAQEALLLRLSQEYLANLLPTSAMLGLAPLFDEAVITLSEKEKHKHWLKKVGVASSTLRMSRPEVDPAILETVSQALEENKKLEITYRYPNGGTKSYHISPWALVQQDVRLYLVCSMDNHTDTPRHLALHRITQAEMKTFSSECPKNFKLDVYLQEMPFNFVHDDDLHHEKISFDFESETTFGILSETPFNKTQTLTQTNDGLHHLEVTLPKTRLFDAWLALWGEDAGVRNLERVEVDVPVRKWK